MQEASPQPVQPGQVLAGKYRVERVLGQGGMGVVVSAVHIALGERVAIKFLLPHVLGKPETVERFLREAQASVRVKSEHVARVSDVGTLDSGAPYMVMEFLEGRDLSEILEQRGPMPIGEAVSYLLQACEAVAEAHALGIVHRDLKPANLFLTRRTDGSPLVKVLDFGISKLTTAESKDLTATQGTMGSPQYMSPEQVRSAKKVDQRSDIWSLGVILHELVSGKSPFGGDTVSAVLAAIVADPPLPLRDSKPDAPAALEAVILRCLEKDANARYGSVGELGQALLPFGPESARLSVERASRLSGGRASMDSMSSEASAPVAPRTVSPEAATVASWNTQAETRRPSKLPLVVGAGVVVALGAVGAFFLLRGDGKAPSEAPATADSTPSSKTGPAIAPPASSRPEPPVVAAAASSAPSVASAEKTKPKGPPPKPGVGAAPPPPKTTTGNDSRTW